MYIKPGQDTGIALMSAGYHSPATYTSLGLGIMQVPYVVISGNADSVGLLRCKRGIRADSIMIHNKLRCDTLANKNYADSAAAYAGGIRKGEFWHTNGTLKRLFLCCF
jgi:hypothetical protein